MLKIISLLSLLACVGCATNSNMSWAEKRAKQMAYEGDSYYYIRYSLESAGANSYEAAKYAHKYAGSPLDKLIRGMQK